MRQSRLILDRYEPLGTAGAGGFGTVQIAWDPRIQRKVAIKTIQLSETDAQRASLPGAQAVQGSGSSTADRWHGVQPWSEYLAEGEGERLDVPGLREFSSGAYGYGDDFEGEGSERDEFGSGERGQQFTALAHLPGLDEARTAAKLQDLRIVTVFDFEVRDRTAYLIMEYVEGITLTRLLVQYDDYLTLDAIAAVFNAVAGALTVAHKAGVLHLDVKPDNILINVDGQAKVTDFGLATLADASGAGTTGGGTIGYMPLEQMRREPLDARTDEWSLASVTYEMLSGDNPFRVPSLDDAPAAIENAELVLPSLCWEDIDEQIDDVIFYALDPDPEQRYASVADFAEEAEKFLGDPEAGKRQLAALVCDALGLDDGAEEDAWEEEDEWPEDGRDKVRLGEKARDLLERLRFSEKLLWFASHALVAVATGFVTWSALVGFTPLISLLDVQGARLVALASAVLVGIVGAVRPPVGVLVSCLVLGFSLIVAGQPLLGGVVAFIGIAWCYAAYRLVVYTSHPVALGIVAVVLVAAVIAVFVLANIPLGFAGSVGVVLVALVVSAFA